MTPMKLCLVVDDFEVIRKVARRIIEQLGYVVTEAGNASDAIDQCQTELPDLIIVDWSLPDIDAIELIAAIRAEDTDRPPVIIYLVTENDPVMLNKALKAGANDYLFKPFDRETMQMKIAELSGSMTAFAEACAADFEGV